MADPRSSSMGTIKRELELELELDADDWAVTRAAELVARGERVRLVIQWRGPLVERIGVKRASGDVEWG